MREIVPALDICFGATTYPDGCTGRTDTACPDAMKRRRSPSYKWFGPRNHFLTRRQTVMKHLYLGIDWGKNFSQLFGFDQNGEVVIEERLKTLDLSVCRKKLRSLKGYSI